MKTKHTNTFYNPNTNELITYESNFSHREGFNCVGCRKIAEAMTTVSKKRKTYCLPINYLWCN